MMDPHVNTIFDPRHEAEVECGCSRCGRRFGHYVLGAGDNEQIVPWDRTRLKPFTIVIRGKRFVLPWQPHKPRSTVQLKGRRTGTGLYLEWFAEVLYVRVVCKCGRNEKLGPEKLDAALFDAGGRLQLRDGVLYL
jgi:hypothetical protein